MADPPGALVDVSPPIAPVDRFPTTLPIIHLSDAEKKGDYTIPYKELPRRAVNSLQAYYNWSTVPINLDRSIAYAAPVQDTSITKTLEVMRGYFGFCCLRQGVLVSDVDISLYADVHKFANFMGFLMARNCKTEQLKKQISVAKKVSCGSPLG